MRELEFAWPSMLHLAWAVPLVLLACAWSVSRTARLLQAFGVDRGRFGGWVRAQSRRRWLRATAFSVAVLFFTGAAVRPRSNPERTTFRREGRDLAVVLDVSRSMLADDIRPNRLERAKLELDRLAADLSGDRIGLVAFAGDAVIVCPLTSNYSYFRSTLKNLTPHSAPQGGTRIGDALRKALSDLLGIESGPSLAKAEEPQLGETIAEAEHRTATPKRPADILLITDGEDHDSYPLHAAEQVRDAGVGLFIVGLGSEEGTPIPIRADDGTVAPLKYEGKVVLSRLDSETLREMLLKVPRGSYTPAGTQGFDLVSIHEGAISRGEKAEIIEEDVTWTEIFQPFLLAGLFFYFLSLVLPERAGPQPVGEVAARAEER